MTAKGHFPCWLRRPIPPGHELIQTHSLLRKYRLNTVCEEAKCPNRLECYTNRTATFLALGKTCTRNCGFCGIDFSKAPPPPEADEPERIALSIHDLGLTHAVITMVSRDDLPDQGAGHIAAIIHAIRQKNPRSTVEVLTSDFGGDESALDLVLAEKPEIFNHNLETVRSLTPHIRHRAEYDRSLHVLQRAKQSSSTIYVKSGIMLGFGEKEEEVFECLEDLKKVGCDIVTIGQYLQPSSRQLRVKEFVPPDRFKIYEEFGLKLKIPHMVCGPFVRSDYNAKLFAQPR